MPQPPAQRDLFQDSTMTFGQHLEELRTCLFRAIVGLAVGCAIGLLPWVCGPVVKFIQTPVENALWNYYQEQAEAKVLAPQEREILSDAGYTSEDDLKRISEIVAKQHVSLEVKKFDPKQLLAQLQVRPDQTLALSSSGSELVADTQGLRKIVLYSELTDDPRIRMKSLNAQETFMIYMKASIMVGVVLASPWVFYQIWSFVAAGLYPHERRYVHLFLPMSLGLFLAGAAVAFFLAFDKVLAFLLSFNRMLGIDPDLRINEWISFVLLLPLGFGISFQLPLVMLFLERIGLITVKTYLASWRMAVLVIFVLAMILTPTGDPYTMMLMAGPLTLLYFGGVLLCKMLPKAKSRFAK
ncbi:MAG: twin-arginine translocase subunit TatC [Thermoguttaceae bacterium]|jgi:sec-independent protein translocase protein TatC